MTRKFSFSVDQNSPTILRIAPSIEILVSAKEGDDYSELWNLWSYFIHNFIHKTPYTYDNYTCIEQGIMASQQTDFEEVKSAFKIAD